MSLILILYAPFLLFLPIALVAGLLFVVVPGGFMIVLGAAYYLSVGFMGLVALAAKGRRDARRASRRRVKQGSAVPRRTRLPAARSVAGPPTLTTAGPRNGQMVELAGTRAAHGAEPDGVNWSARADPAHARKADDARRADRVRLGGR